MAIAVVRAHNQIPASGWDAHLTHMIHNNTYNSEQPEDELEYPHSDLFGTPSICPFTDPFTLGSIALARGTEVAKTINPEDLDEHFYVLGRSGTGKSNLLKQLALADAARGSGLCFIDPIGSTAEKLVTDLSRYAATAASGCTKTSRDAARRDRSPLNPCDASGRDVSHPAQKGKSPVSNAPYTDKDIIYFDAADVDNPIGINPLYNVAPEDRAKTVSDILQMFEGIWHDTGWGPRMESIFRAALHTLVENPHCMRPSLLTVFRLLLDESFRAETKTAIANKQVLDWWDFRFDRGDLNSRTRREWVEPVLNKIDTLSLDPVIRNIIGQPRCNLDFEEIVRRKQILIVNLNQNKIGLDNAAFIGMLVLSRLRQAAAKVGSRDNPFTLTLDEAHSFPTMELTKIIHQGRHSGLFARLAHQNLEQFDPKIGSALRNGCGSLAVFAVGSRDAETIVNDLEHQHRDRCLELINMLARGECFLRLTEDGAPQPPSAYPTAITYGGHGTEDGQEDRLLQGVINRTRERFAISRLNAEFQIAFAHDDLTREDHLKWKSLFRTERRNKEDQHTKQKREKDRNKKEVQATALGGAATELQNLANQIFGNPDANSLAL